MVERRFHVADPSRFEAPQITYHGVRTPAENEADIIADRNVVVKASATQSVTGDASRPTRMPKPSGLRGVRGRPWNSTGRVSLCGTNCSGISEGDHVHRDRLRCSDPNRPPLRQEAGIRMEAHSPDFTSTFLVSFLGCSAIGTLTVSTPLA